MHQRRDLRFQRRRHAAITPDKITHRLVAFILIGTALAACSSAGSRSTLPQTPPQVAPAAAGAATGTLTIKVPPETNSFRERPSYISSATKQAALFIDTVTTAAGSSSSCAGGCTIAYSTTAGTHTLRAEIAGAANVVLAEGAKSVTLVPGPGNNFTITLNGAAALALWVSTTSTTTHSISGTYAIEDSAKVPITSAPAGASTAFDNTPVTFSALTGPGFTGTASFTTSGTSTTLSAPDANGNDYPFTATCGAGATGTFTITATSGSSSGGISPAQLSGLSLSYPSSNLTVSMHTYRCSSGTIHDASVLALDGSVSSANACTAGSVTTCSVTLTTSEPNDVVVVYCAADKANETFSAPTASGLTFTQRGATHSGNTRSESFWYAIASTPISESIKCSWSSATGAGMLAFGVSGANTTAPFDTNASVPYFSTVASSGTSIDCVISTSNANDFIYGIAYGNTGQITGNPGSPFSNILATNNDYVPGSYAIFSAVQTNLTVTWTVTNHSRLAWACDAIAEAGT